MKVVTNEKVKAFVDVEVNEMRINGIKLLRGEKEDYLGYPTEKGGDGKYYEIVVPVTQNVEEEIIKAVKVEYERRTKNG